MRILYIPLFVVLSFLSLTCSWQTNSDEFPIVAWYGPEEHFADLAGFENVQKAGFTYSFSPFGEKSTNLSALTAAHNSNIKLLIADDRTQNIDVTNDSSFFVLDSIAADYKNHDAFGAYYIMDEPGKNDFAKLGKIVSRLAQVDSLHPAYINLLPTYATSNQLDTTSYTGYIESFINTINPRLLSFDSYPILETEMRPDYYYNLEFIRKIAQQHNIPFWSFVLSVYHSPYPKPIMSHLRTQAYSGLAYGAAGIQYFTYAKPVSQLWNFREALVDENGNPTPIFHLVTKLNSEITIIGNILQKLKSTGVYHSHPVPDSCSALIPGLPVSKIDSENILAGFFKGRKKEQYVLLLNKNYNSGVLAKLFFQDKISKIAEIKKDYTDPFVQEWANTNREKDCQILFKAGEGKLFKIYQSSSIF